MRHIKLRRGEGSNLLAVVGLHDYFVYLSQVLDRLGVEDGDEFVVVSSKDWGARSLRTPTRNRARRTDPTTSHTAAASVSTTLRQSQKDVLRVFGAVAPLCLTDEELIGEHEKLVEQGHLPPQSESGLRTRRAELVDAGKLIDSGSKRKLKSGREAIVWRLPPAPSGEELRREVERIAADPADRAEKQEVLEHMEELAPDD